MMARDTIAATIIDTTIIGNEEARSDPGFFFALSDKQLGDGQHDQSGNAEIHQGE